MKAKYVIMSYLSEEEVVYLFPESETHADVAHRLSAQNDPLLAKMTVVSAGKVYFGNDVGVVHGSVSLGINRNAEREAEDQRFIKNRFRDGMF